MIINTSKASKSIDLNIQNGTGTDSIVIGGTTDQGPYSLPKATGINSVAQGSWTEAAGNRSHAEGYGTYALGNDSHAEGNQTTATGPRSHTEGEGTIANHLNQHVFGQYNVPDNSTASSSELGNYIEIVGNGASSSTRTNARTLDWNANEWIGGNLNVQGSITATTYYGDGSHLTGISTSGYLPITGGTLTGDLTTSSAESVGGSKLSSQSTIEGLVNEVRISHGRCGSVSLSTGYNRNNITIPTGWYNYLYVPHRNGGNNTNNNEYGTLYLSHMTNNYLGNDFIITVSGATINLVRRMFTGFSTTAILSASSWGYNYQQTISVTGITTTCNVVISPSTAPSLDAWSSNGISCVQQQTDSLLFAAKSAPTTAVYLNIMVT